MWASRSCIRHNGTSLQYGSSHQHHLVLNIKLFQRPFITPDVAVFCQSANTLKKTANVSLSQGINECNTPLRLSHVPSPIIWLTRSCRRSHLLPNWGWPGAGPPLTPACRPRHRWPPWLRRPRAHGSLCRCGRSSRLWIGLQAWIRANMGLSAGRD